MPVAAIGAIATVASGAMASRSADKAARAQQQGYDAASAEQARQYDQSREDAIKYSEPYRNAGNAALNQLTALYGLGGQPADYSGFQSSPDYQFARDEGMRGIERSAAARGGLASGNTLTALSQYNSGLASQNYGNYVNQLSNLAGAGQNATQQLTSNLGNMSMNYGNQVGQNAVGVGNARASGITNRANILGSGVNQLAGFGTQAVNWAQGRQLNPYQITGAATQRMQ